jgi:hypothetical protein
MKHLLHSLALIAILLISASAYSEGDGFQNFYVPLEPLDANEPVPKKVCDPNQDYYIECIRASTGGRQRNYSSGSVDRGATRQAICVGDCNQRCNLTSQGDQAALNDCYRAERECKSQCR